MTELLVRPARVTDLPSLTDIYNHYVRTSPATFEITPVTLAQRREWFSHYHESGRHRLLVAVLGEQVIGYASSSLYHARAAYETTVESSIYLHHEHHGRKVGSQLYTELFRLLATEDVHRVVAGATLPNPASVALHRKFGFREIGVYHEVGRKFGRYWDVVWFEKPLPAHDAQRNQHADSS